MASLVTEHRWQDFWRVVLCVLEAVLGTLHFYACGARGRMAQLKRRGVAVHFGGVRVASSKGKTGQRKSGGRARVRRLEPSPPYGCTL